MITAVADPSHVGEARRLSVEFARRAGAAEALLGRIALVATEMATNIVKHAAGRGGMVALQRCHDAGGRGVELLAIDSGPGMADIDACLADGFSTAGSVGTGLGAISRQADLFRVYSRPGLGAAVLARFVLGPPEPGFRGIDIGAVGAIYPGETVCGDDWAFNAGVRGDTLLVVDGSGHGAAAARAAEAAVKVFNDHADEPLVPLVERVHRALVPTRGAALAITRIDGAERLVRFVGVGNIAGALLNGAEARQMVSHNGTAGHVAPRIREFTYPFAGSPCVILHSDGLSNRWRMGDYPGLAASHPALVAGMLFRDFRRAKDDATIVAMRPR